MNLPVPPLHAPSLERVQTAGLCLDLPGRPLTMPERIVLADGHSNPDPWGCIQVTWHRVGRRDTSALSPKRAHLGPPLVEAIDQGVDWVATHLACGERRIASPTQLLAREIVINALSHRDYAPRFSRPVELDLYTDAVTITSPGMPLAEADLRGGHFRRAARRNADLMALLEPPLGRPLQRGVGWERARRAARAAGIALRAEIVATSTVVHLRIDAQRRAAVLDPGDRRHRVPALAWQEQVLHYLGTRGVSRAAAIREELGLPVSTLRQVLEELEDRGMVAPTEDARRSPRQHWMLVR